MEEEYNEHELEERFYSMLHYVDDKGTCNINKDEATHIVESVPRSTVRRYWRTSTGGERLSLPAPAALSPAAPIQTKPKEEKRTLAKTVKKSADVSLFQIIHPQNFERTIEILDIDKPLELVTSDEDEVIEVALPPKPTITIESSDEDEVRTINKPAEENNLSDTKKQTKTSTKGEREVSASPVPSVVSSVSDEFIRGDCIAFNISSKRPDSHSFDFSLHGSDLVGTPSKRKKKRKKKDGNDRNTSTPIKETAMGEPINTPIEECFATPKSKAENKRQKTKSYVVSEKSFPNPDVYDSDSNDVKNTSSYKVTNQSLPNADVYESDSNQSETLKEQNITHEKLNDKGQKDNIDMVDKPCDSFVEQIITVDKSSNSEVSLSQPAHTKSVVDLTDDYDNTVLTDISENIVMANVTGFSKEEDNDNYVHNQVLLNTDPSNLGSTKIPAILNEDLDFDNLKGNSQICHRRKFSLSTFRAEMEKFYNESWGGEDFNHREIQKSMSRDKKLWMIDQKDRMPSHYRKKIICNYCSRVGHRDDTCRLKPAVCYMCGDTGHYESRCPRKICVNCGSPNFVYSNMCRNCSTWGRVTCAECQQLGHPASHCPDVWRRYHNTIDANTPLVENRSSKRYSQQFCSGCTRRGHLVHTCRLALPFSGLPINSPYVLIYSPVYMSHQPSNPFMQDGTISSAILTPNTDRNKRYSKSPTVHETHVIKRRNITQSDNKEERKSLFNGPRKRHSSQNKESLDGDNKLNVENNIVGDASKTQLPEVETAPDYIPIGATNRDKMGHVIQDNEVSDTSDVVTSARICVTNDIADKLKSKEGELWLKETTESHNVVVQHTDIKLFLSVSGKIADQELFQTALRDWAKVETNKDVSKSDNENDVSKDSSYQDINSDIPKNRNSILRKLGKALDSLKNDIGDPNALFKELTYLQNHHQQLLKKKVISPKKLSNNRVHINEMLKKLNMVLLGQAGLADGSTHLRELQSLQERLTKYRQKNIPFEMRKEIGEHYHSIFSAVQRNDYADLLKKYYRSKKYQKVFKNTKLEYSVTSNQSTSQKVEIRRPSVQNNVFTDISSVTVNDDRPNKKKNELKHREPHMAKTFGKLALYHKKVMHIRPMNSELKAKRLELARKLHSHMASLGNNQKITSKKLKKIKKTQELAQSFLSNVYRGRAVDQ